MTGFSFATETLDENAAAAARRRIDALTKPVGSLGRIEALAVQLSAIAGRVVDRAYERKAVLIGAGDHGVTAQGVSAYPAEVTPQMVGAFLAGHAAINAFARAVRADVYVANFGVRTPCEPHELLIDAVVGHGTGNFGLLEPAMPPGEVLAALVAGKAAFENVLARAPYDVIALGDMGIGNTTSAAALVAALTGADPASVTGRGTGVDDARLARKREVVARAVEALRAMTGSAAPDSSRVMLVASQVGGYEIVGLAGAIIAGMEHRIPIVLDGFIVAAAALVAQRIAPAAIDFCIAAHCSQEPGHRIALEALGLEPLFDLELRLGEASGAALALPLVEAASRMISEMKTFAEAGVSGESESIPS
jgi:nicotinate-nucleotide--dimethylbenzimidazole phosphoribosyltransferase